MTKIHNIIFLIIVCFINIIVYFAGSKNVHAATLSLCNYSSYVLELSISVQKIDNFVTIGWYHVLPGRCDKIEQKNEILIEADSLYASFKEQEYYDTYAIDTDEIKYFCVQEGDFIIQEALNCPELHQYYSGFREIFFSEKEKKFTATVQEKPNYQKNEANIAGLQRLLNVAKFKNIKIDGKRDKNLDLTLQKIVRENNLLLNLSEVYSNRNAKLYKTLIQKAQKEQMKKGLFVCNDTNMQIWAVFGEQNEQNTIVKGWKQITSNSCSRVIKEALNKKNRIFYYAEAQKYPNSSKQQKPELVWGGNVQLCVDDNSFVIENHQNCEKDGFQTKGFAEISVKQKIWIIHFVQPKK